MNALPVPQSYLLLIGSIVLTVFIFRLSLLINDYCHKRRQRNSRNINWQKVPNTAHGNVKRSDYPKITTGNHEAQTMNEINLRMTISARIQQAISELHAARLNLAIVHCVEAHENLFRANKEIELIKKEFSELLGR
ncbi:hypothetical protein ACQR7C_10790 [Salmonella enterica]|uniref:hypothetical protein n=1 Tax=Salmonella enterica TaxID=28901 RepID=UPI003D2ED304